MQYLSLLQLCLTYNLQKLEIRTLILLVVTEL
jgi:hypothetical protein